jgi:hypothetical protein
MNIDEYREKVIEFFKSGKALDDHYKEMANAVLDMSESDGEKTREIDKIILGENYWRGNYGR